MKITKDFVLGLLVGIAGMSWVTNKKFASIIEEDRKKRKTVEEATAEIQDVEIDDIMDIFHAQGLDDDEYDDFV